LINLIKNEFIKLRKRKNFRILLLILTGVILLNTVIYKYAYNDNDIHSSYYYYYDENYIENELSSLKKENEQTRTYYLSLKTEQKLLEISNRYNSNSWQFELIHSYYYIFENYVEAVEFSGNKEAITAYNEMIAKFDADDWKYFVNKDKEKIESELEEIILSLSNTIDKKEIAAYESQKANLLLAREIANLRLDKNISFENNYLNRALINYENARIQLLSLENTDEMTREQEQTIQNLEEEMTINKYIVENGIDHFKEDNLRGMLSSCMSSNLFIILVILVVVGSTIISDEMQKGTIKLLLIKPHTRNKILASKFLVLMLLIPILIIFTFVVQFIIGAIFFGVSSIGDPILIYHFANEAVFTLNIVAKYLLDFVLVLPQIILLATLAFALGTIFTTNILGITVPLLGLFGYELINLVATTFNVHILKYFVTMNWDLSLFTFGKLAPMTGMNLILAIILCFIYLIIMLVVSFVVFKKRNIKNV